LERPALSLPRSSVGGSATPGPEAPGFDLLIVEDDRPLAELLARQLTLFGHRTRIVGDGRAALDEVFSNSFDIIILDWILPSMDGVTVLQRLRQAGVSVPILMLTALGQSSNKVEGLNAGADDYLVKPVDPQELNARLHALHRARRWTSDAGDTLSAGDIVVSPAKFRAWRGGKPMELPNIEFKLLMEFVRNAGTVLTRPMLLERVWQYDYEPATNVVEAYIRRLRVKLTEYGDDPIITVRGVGYRLRD
jgi:two-component system OmpR family response regulator